MNFSRVQPARKKSLLPLAVPLLALSAAVLTACGGSSVDTLQAPVAQAPVSCTVDTAVPNSYEEGRLVNKLLETDEQSFSQRILQASGFDRFGPEFAQQLCKDGISGAANYDAAMALMKTAGTALWTAALDRVQGRKVEGTLPQGDDRMLYWARLTMTQALRQWKPDFDMTTEQRDALQNELERASRGQFAIDFPAGQNYRRILVSGFDPFTLGTPGVNNNPNIRIGNPSGAIALALNGKTLTLDDGSTAVIQTYLLPVNYPPFLQGQQEDTLGPWFQPGPKRLDASVSISQGRFDFDLEHFNGRYQLATIPGNDNIFPDCRAAGGYPSELDCDIYPPARWYGQETRPWVKETPPQFTESTLPFQALIDANTGEGIINPDNKRTTGFKVKLNDDYSLQSCSKGSAGPYERNCALSGGGGNYLSNASAYRNTLMRDAFGLNIPAGHIHTPIMTRFSSDSDDLITDATFESYRDSIVSQGSNIIFALAKTLSKTAAAPSSAP
ncbi:hypothetical protein [Amphibiibacter pelophylacis]|uniref:Uncharacterized protein n=1 Tax=Amphibiibacter pelophylacis TaxID=1799477 RepID=A0ACC6P0A6_9BURK